MVRREGAGARNLQVVEEGEVVRVEAVGMWVQLATCRRQLPRLRSTESDLVRTDSFHSNSRS